MKARILAAVLLSLGPSLAAAQDPSREYFTIATPRFRVSFTRPLEAVARRVAANAERAYDRLAAELHPPRGIIEVLVTDDFDFSNGSATVHPTNRIVVYAMPPVNDFGLRYTTDWAQMVVTHELAHVFHLDRVRGIWALGQKIFGRSPFLFPNNYQPGWLIEGLAVYEESRHAGQGRIEGAEHKLFVRAAAIDHRFPRIGDASLARPTFPQGSSAYGYGSLFLAYLAGTRGDSSIGRLVESSSGTLIPYLVDRPARSAFGISFAGAWNEWRDSILKGLAGDSARAPLPDWKSIASEQLALNYPRRADSGTVTFTATSGRDVLSAYATTPDGGVRRLGPRKAQSPTVKLPSGETLFSQYEYIGPYSYRSDLYVQRDGGRPRRVTTNERLFTPDTRADGAIMAMQVLEGATRLVRVGLDGSVTPITRTHPDTLYSEPRWSSAGDRIVASRWIRGGIAQVVVMDSLASNVRVLISTNSRVAASPSWSPDDRAIVFSDGETLFQLDLGANVLSEIGNASSGVFEPEFVSPTTLAAIALGSRGYEVGTGASGVREGLDLDAFRDSTPDRRLPALAIDSSPAASYSALRQLRPRYWVPTAESGYDGAYLLGGYTEAWDILRRHYVYASARIPTDNSGVNWSAEYQYRGFGRPVIATSVSRDWTPFAVFDRSSPRNRVGTLRRRISDAEMLATFVRQRVRSSLSLSLGAGIDHRDYVGDPPEIRAAVDTGGMFNRANFPRVSLSASYARYYVPSYAISPEDGFTIAVTARERFASGFNATGGPSTSVVSALSLFKSLDLPGYAHHVLAARGSAGWADTRTNSYFDVGGVSGGTYQLFPGYTVGEGRRTFGVRGFAPGSAQGIRAASASVEYRAPLALRHATLSTLPGFLQRSSLSLFGDYGIAWCPSTSPSRQVCVDPSQEIKTDLASVGAELSINAGILSWDAATRLRLGVALPVHNGSALGARSLTPYFTTGISF